MELTRFIAEWLKVNSPNRWDSLKTNLNFKHRLFSFFSSFTSRGKSAQQQKSCFYHHFLWLIGRKKAIYYPTSFAHINATINAHRHYTLGRKWGRKRGVRGWGISAKDSGAREGREGEREGRRGREECVRGVEVRWGAGREWESGIKISDQQQR